MVNTVPNSTDSPESFTDTNSDRENTKLHQIRLNHPKNYLAVPLAVSISDNPAEYIQEYAVNAVTEAQLGAQELGLVTSDETLTELGDTVTITAIREHSSIIETLEEFKSLHGSSKRFINVFPEWRHVTERIAFQYEPTNYLVEFLRQQGKLTLQEIAWLLWKRDPALAETIFLHPDLINNDPSDAPKTSQQLQNQNAFQSKGPFQFKSMLYHCGILSSRGKDTTSLNPTTDIWNLDPDFD